MDESSDIGSPKIGLTSESAAGNSRATADDTPSVIIERAVFDACVRPGQPGLSHHLVPSDVIAAAVLAALTAAGFKILPREPTEEMVEALRSPACFNLRDSFRRVWDAASPRKHPIAPE